MITSNPILGVLFHAVGALSAALCYTPQKATRRWSWQTYWLAQASVCWLVLPLLGAWLTIPDLMQVLKDVNDISLKDPGSVTGSHGGDRFDPFFSREAAS